MCPDFPARVYPHGYPCGSPARVVLFHICGAPTRDGTKSMLLTYIFLRRCCECGVHVVHFGKYPVFMTSLLRLPCAGEATRAEISNIARSELPARVDTRQTRMISVFMEKVYWLAVHWIIFHPRGKIRTHGNTAYPGLEWLDFTTYNVKWYQAICMFKLDA